MKRFFLVMLGLLWLGPLHAQKLFSDSFDDTVIAPLFPRIAGIYQLPAGPTADQLTWLLGELAAGQTTTADEVNAHFDAAWLAQNNVAATQNFIASVRASYPNAVIRDLLSLTPVRAVAVIDTPGSPAPYGFLTFGARYSGTKRIVQFGVSSYGGNVQFVADRTLSLAQAADKFVTLSSAPALLAARIRPNGTCEALADRNASQLRATASIFKTWVLGGAAQSVAMGAMTLATPVPLVASELAPSGLINVEPLGTQFPFIDLAILMMGNSDNTATDLVHQVVGRPLINQIVADFGMAQPTVLTPLLGISEQFHVFRSFDLPVAQSFINGTEVFQQDFLDNQIVPLGPLNAQTAPFSWPQLHTSTWRATPHDICQAFASLRRLPNGSDAKELVERSFGAAAAQPEVRNAWDRVWYKGGSLQNTATTFTVLTHAWMLENAGEDPYVLVAMSNSDAGQITQNPGSFDIQSVTSRILQLLAEMP